MPREMATHFNPDDERRYKGKTQCGEVLAKVNHSTNAAHVNCGRCLRSLSRTFYTGPKGPLDAHGEELP